MGLALTVETFYDSPFIDPSYALAMCDAVKDIGLTLDTATLLSKRVSQAQWGPLFPFLRHVHVADAEIGQSHQVPYGKGGLDLPGLVADLRKVNYAAAISIEYIGPLPVGRTSVAPEPEIVRLRSILEDELAKETSSG